MRSDNAVGLAQVTGAACSLRLRWPQDNGGGGGNNGVAHLGTTPTQQFTVTSFAAGTEQQTLFQGCSSTAFQSTAAAGNGFGIFWSGRASWFTEQVGGPLVNDFCCWSIRATIAYDAPGGASLLDHGIFIFAGSNNTMFSAAPNAGIQLGCTGPAEFRMRAVRQNGGAVTVNDVVAAGLTPNPALYNTLELRVISGSNTQDPVVFGLINNVVVTPRRSWTAVAGILPPPNIVAGQLGYQLGVINISSGNFPNMHVHEIVVSAAQKEGDLF